MIGGYIYDAYGAVVLFRICAIMCSVSALLAFASWRIFPAPHATPQDSQEQINETHVNVLYSKAALDDMDESTSGVISL